MKLRCTAALALVGWYLMIFPANVERGPGGPTGTAAYVWGLYPNSSDCNVERTHVAALLAERQKHPQGGYLAQWATTCVATDDHRLKGADSRLIFMSASEKDAIARKVK